MTGFKGYDKMLETLQMA